MLQRETGGPQYKFRLLPLVEGEKHEFQVHLKKLDGNANVSIRQSSSRFEFELNVPGWYAVQVRNPSTFAPISNKEIFYHG